MGDESVIHRASAAEDSSQVSIEKLNFDLEFEEYRAPSKTTGATQSPPFVLNTGSIRAAADKSYETMATGSGQKRTGTTVKLEEQSPFLSQDDEKIFVLDHKPCKDARQNPSRKLLNMQGDSAKFMPSRQPPQTRQPIEEISRQPN